MENKMVTHEEVMRIARRDPDFIREERRIKPFFDLARQIYQKRKELNLSQKQLAKLSKTYQTRISKIETAELNPQLSTLISIAEALDCEISITLKSCCDIRLEAMENLKYFSYSDVLADETTTVDTTDTEIHVDSRSVYAIPD
jgi:transcriptional regulator with XRE-family HTH domain